MFSSIVFTAVLASSAVLLSQAIVVPNEPGPGDSFDEGQTCHIGWGGDTSSGSTTAWKNMAIELMTGPNEAMIHITTVAQGQDGTVAGTFDYTCPQVTPNSPIYFYQFTAPGTSNYTWTGRFTIAAADGSSTPAQQTEQSDGQTVAYGTGALVDPSTAIGPPSFQTTGGSSSSSSNSSAVSGSTNSASAPPSLPSSAPPTSSTHSSAASKSSDTSGSSSGSTSASPPTKSGASGAIAVGPVDTRLWPFVAALTASAMAFTIFL